MFSNTYSGHRKADVTVAKKLRRIVKSPKGRFPEASAYGSKDREETEDVCVGIRGEESHDKERLFEGGHIPSLVVSPVHEDSGIGCNRVTDFGVSPPTKSASLSGPVATCYSDTAVSVDDQQVPSQTHSTRGAGSGGLKLTASKDPPEDIGQPLGPRRSQATGDQRGPEHGGEGEQQNEEEERRQKFTFSGRRLSNLVATAAQSQQFFEGLDKMRERLVEQNRDQEPIPVFNKRLFAAHGTVVLTAEARRLMARNARQRADLKSPLLSKAQIQSLRCVVNGLRLIHRGQDHVKDALSHVISFERYSPYQYIVKRPYEAQLSCYYILQGAVQVTYDMDISETRSVFQPDIIYNHGAGEFLGLLSPDGLSEDLSPPATVYTTEPSEFLRIDRTKFHAVVEKIGQLQREEKMSFLSKPSNVMATLPPEALEKVLPHVHRMDYPANRIILRQGDSTDYLYFILSGKSIKMSRNELQLLNNKFVSL